MITTNVYLIIVPYLRYHFENTAFRREMAKFDPALLMMNYLYNLLIKQWDIRMMHKQSEITSTKRSKSTRNASEA